MFGVMGSLLGPREKIWSFKKASRGVGDKDKMERSLGSSKESRGREEQKGEGGKKMRRKAVNDHSAK